MKSIATSAIVDARIEPNGDTTPSTVGFAVSKASYVRSTSVRRSTPSSMGGTPSKTNGMQSTSFGILTPSSMAATVSKTNGSKPVSFRSTTASSNGTATPWTKEITTELPPSLPKPTTGPFDDSSDAGEIMPHSAPTDSFEEHRKDLDRLYSQIYLLQEDIASIKTSLGSIQVEVNKDFSPEINLLTENVSKVNGRVGEIETVKFEIQMMQQRLKRMEEAKQQRPETPALDLHVSSISAAIRSTSQHTSRNDNDIPVPSLNAFAYQVASGKKLPRKSPSALSTGRLPEMRQEQPHQGPDPMEESGSSFQRSSPASKAKSLTPPKLATTPRNTDPNGSESSANDSATYVQYPQIHTKTPDTADSRSTPTPNITNPYMGPPPIPQQAINPVEGGHETPIPTLLDDLETAASAQTAHPTQSSQYTSEYDLVIPKIEAQQPPTSNADSITITRAHPAPPAQVIATTQNRQSRRASSSVRHSPPPWDKPDRPGAPEPSDPKSRKRRKTTHSDGTTVATPNASLDVANTSEPRSTSTGTAGSIRHRRPTRAPDGQLIRSDGKIDRRSVRFASHIPEGRRHKRGEGVRDAEGYLLRPDGITRDRRSVRMIAAKGIPRLGFGVENGAGEGKEGMNGEGQGVERTGEVDGETAIQQLQPL